MFRKTVTERQMSLFSGAEDFMSKRASKKYLDPKAWHNQFFRMVTSKIDEEIFKVLFPEGKKQGRPTASIRILVAMSILKEGFGCSDEDMFEKCDYDMLTRRALGLSQLDDVSPSLDTYYLFRRRVCEYDAANGTDLMKTCFESVTGEQVAELMISGKCVRMDSKLIGSNIAHSSRYELIHKTLVVFLKAIAIEHLDAALTEQAKEYLAEDSTKTVYRSDKDTLNNRLQAIGNYIHKVLESVSETAPKYELLKRVFNDQYEVVEGVVKLRDKKTISANSLQSPYDEDASFRNKNDKKTEGYVTNITETVEEGKPSLITSVQTETATHGDCSFLPDAVEASRRVTGQDVEEIFADGAYQSPENREYAEKEQIALKTGKMQGGCRFILNLKEGTDQLTVTDTTTGVVQKAIYMGYAPKPDKNGKKWRRWKIPFKHKDGIQSWRYFPEDEIRRSELRQKILSEDPKELAKRNNVEAAMFQYSFHTRNGKTRYRGLKKHRIQAYHRCMWMNLRRIVIFIGGLILTPILALLGLLRNSKRTSMEFFQKLLKTLYSPWTKPERDWQASLRMSSVENLAF